MIPQLQPVSLDLVVHTPVVCNDRCPWSMSSCSSSTFFTSPVIMQRRCTVEVPQVQFSPATVGHYSCATEKGTRLSALLLMVAAKGFFDAFCVIFRASPVVPELSASFSSFRALTIVSARWLQGVPESPVSSICVKNNDNNSASDSSVPHSFLLCHLCCEMDPSWQPRTGAAQRRRG